MRRFIRFGQLSFGQFVAWLATDTALRLLEEKEENVGGITPDEERTLEVYFWLNLYFFVSQVVGIFRFIRSLVQR